MTPSERSPLPGRSSLGNKVATWKFVKDKALNFDEIARISSLVVHGISHETLVNKYHAVQLSESPLEMGIEITVLQIL